MGRGQALVRVLKEDIFEEVTSELRPESELGQAFQEGAAIAGSQGKEPACQLPGVERRPVRGEDVGRRGQRMKVLFRGHEQYACFMPRAMDAHGGF